MIAVSEHAEGCILAVRAQPGARKAGVTGEQAGALKVAVTAPPEDGRANQALTELLRDWLGLKRSQVELAGGATNRNKQVLIRGVKPDELRSLLESPRGVGRGEPGASGTGAVGAGGRSGPGRGAPVADAPGSPWSRAAAALAELVSTFQSH